MLIASDITVFPVPLPLFPVTCCELPPVLLHGLVENSATSEHAQANQTKKWRIHEPVGSQKKGYFCEFGFSLEKQGEFKPVIFMKMACFCESSLLFQGKYAPNPEKCPIFANRPFANRPFIGLFCPGGYQSQMSGDVL